MLNFFRKSIDPIGNEYVVAAAWDATAEKIELALQGTIVSEGRWFPRKGSMDHRKKFTVEKFEWKQAGQSAPGISLEILVRDVDGDAGVSWQFSPVGEDLHLTVEETNGIICDVIDKLPKPLKSKE